MWGVMNHKPGRATHLALVASIALSSSALASCPEPEYFNVVYLNALGQRLTSNSSGQDSQGLDKGTANRKTFDIAVQNNLCATLLITNQLRSAKRSCDRALHLGRMDNRRCGANGQCSDASAMLAIIHSNLGVVLALMSENSKAEASFSEALRLDPQQDIVAHNLTALGSPCLGGDVVTVE